MRIKAATGPKDSSRLVGISPLTPSRMVGANSIQSTTTYAAMHRATSTSTELKLTDQGKNRR